MKKPVKIILIILAVLLALIVVGGGIFLYFHGRTSPYQVDEAVHNALISQKSDKEEDEVRIMSSNLLVYYPSWHGSGSKSIRTTDARPRAKIYFDVLENYKPDVIGVQEVCDRWFNCLMRNDLGYKFVQPAKTAFTVRLTGLMYNENTTELMEYGDYVYSEGDNPRLRCLVWGLFRDRATDKQYVVTSTHFDLIRSDKEAGLKVMTTQMNELIEQSEMLKEKYNVPVFHTGDFNSVNNVENWEELYYGASGEYLESLRENAEAIKIDQAPSIYEEMVKALKDAKLEAEETSFAGETDIESPAYDHIFINGDARVRNYTSVSDPLMYKLSDHFSIFADVVLP